MRWTRHQKREHRPSGTRHFVDNGSVGCPVRQKDVDLDTCLMCAALEGVVKEGEDTVLYCSPVMRHLEGLPF
jgi:hypothetical protein